jgi:hypothetical protein
MAIIINPYLGYVKMQTSINKRIIKTAPLVLLFLIFFQLFVVVVPAAEASQRKYGIGNSAIFAAGGASGGGGPSGTLGAGGGSEDEEPAEDEEEDDEDKPACEEVFDYPGAWLACLVIDLVDKFTNDAIDAVNSMLAVEPEEVNDDGLKQAWSYFRNIASLFLVLIGLAMIIGQAISKE